MNYTSLFVICPYIKLWREQKEKDQIYNRSFKSFLKLFIGDNWLDFFFIKITKVNPKTKRNDISNLVKLINQIENFSYN